MDDKRKDMHIDDRLKLLTTDCESLHDSCQQLHQMMVRQIEENDKKTAQLREQDQKIQQQNTAMLAAIRAYLDGMEGA